MKTTIITSALTIAIGFLSSSALAYEDERLEEVCKKPKFHDFSLPTYHEPEKIEVPSESVFEFKVSVWSNPDTIKLTARKEKIPFTVESNSSFHRVKAKLPADLNGKFARINAYVKAVLGCDEQAGWLVKIADKKGAETAPAPAVTAPADKTAAPEQKTAASDSTPAKAEAEASAPATAKPVETAPAQ